MDPTKRAVFEEEMAKIKSEYVKRKPTEITKDQILEAVKMLEQAKFEAQQKMYNMVRA